MGIILFNPHKDPSELWKHQKSFLFCYYYFLPQIIVPVQGVAIWITYSYHKVTTLPRMWTRGIRDKRFHPQLAEFSHESIIPGRMTSVILGF